MGHGYEYKCNKCGYELSAYLGIGFDMHEYLESDIKFDWLRDDIRNGKYGEEISLFTQDHPNAYITINDNVILYCKKCERYEKATDFTMLDAGSIENFGIYEIKNRSCSSCGGEMRVIGEDELENLTCPHCKRKFDYVSRFMWD